MSHCPLALSCDCHMTIRPSSQVLTQHRKSQSVLCESLKLLEQLARHYEREGREKRETEERREGREGGDELSSSVIVSQLKTILSAFW